MILTDSDELAVVCNVLTMAQTYPGIPETSVVAELRAGHPIKRRFHAIERSKPRVFPMEVPLTPEEMRVLGSAIAIILEEIEDAELHTVIGLVRDEVKVLRSQLASVTDARIATNNYLDELF